MSDVLKVDDLRSGYGQLPVLDGVSLNVGAGEIVSVLGANGAGKTTLLLTISGHLPAFSGHVQFEGESFDRVPAHEAAPRGLVMVPEGGRLFPFMTVLENLELGAYHPAARARMAQSLDEVMGLFPILAERRGQLAGRLSGGERQMCAVARAMMSLPKLLMLDEPSLGLAPKIVKQIFELVASIRATGTSILLVEQNVRGALKVADFGYVMEGGRIVLEGPAAQLRDDPRVRDAYLGGAGH